MITVTRRGARLVAVKTAEDGAEERRRSEARLLARLDHPGVVEFVDLVDGPPLELHLAFAGTDTWARRPPTSDATTALAAVATTVADLHALGIAHTALLPEHVIVATDGRPVLCGLADAGPADEAGRAADVEALADLIDHVAAGLGPDAGEPLARVARSTRSDGIDATTVAARLAALDRPRSSVSARARPSGRALVVLGAAAAVVIGVVSVVRAGDTGVVRTTDAASMSTSTSTRPAPTSASPSTPVPSTTAPPSTTSSSAPSPTSTSSSTTSSSTALPASPSSPATTASPTTAAPSSPMVDDAEGAGVEVVHAGRRYGVGLAGDVVVVGDWDCDGTPTPALLRPDGGLVAVFAAWPGPGTSLAPTTTAVHPGAIDLRVDRVGDCDHLRVVGADGSTLMREEPA